MDSLNSQTSLEVGGVRGGSVDGFDAILMAQNVALCVAGVFTLTGSGGGLCVRTGCRDSGTTQSSS